MDNKLIEKAVEFHGHKCGGLLLGLKAADTALEIFNRQAFVNGEIVVTMKKKACPADGMTVSLGVRADNNTLKFDEGLAYDITLFDIIEEKEVALRRKEAPIEMSNEDYMNYIIKAPNTAIYEIIEL
ncbi:MAG: hypothetical protein E7218_05900 [Anaerofustis stercorihominis]|nr:hypothetical protein [Anaerofustis stercorihominis]